LVRQPCRYRAMPGAHKKAALVVRAAFSVRPTLFLGLRAGFLPPTTLATSRFPWFVCVALVHSAFASPCEPGDILGLDVTPETFRPYQRPLVISPGPPPASSECLRLSPARLRFPSSGFHLTVLVPWWAMRHFRPASPGTCSGLHATPASQAQQSRLTPYLRSGSRLTPAFSGIEPPVGDLCSREHPRRVGPVTFPRSRNAATSSVWMLPLPLRLAARRSCR